MKCQKIDMYINFMMKMKGNCEHANNDGNCENDGN